VGDVLQIKGHMMKTVEQELIASELAENETTSSIIASQDLPVLPNANYLVQMAMEKNLDLNRLQQIIDMQERQEAKAAKREFVKAKNAAQSEMEVIVKDAKNDQKNSRYARLEAVSRKVTPCITSHGFALSLSERPSTPDQPVREGDRRFVLTLSHVAGHSEEYIGDFPIDGKGAKGGNVMSETQGYVSTGSYAQRVLICRALNLTIADSDTDGELEKAKLSENQIADINDQFELCRLGGRSINVPRFVKWLRGGIDGGDLSDVYAMKYDEAIQALRAERKKTKPEVSE